MPAPDEQVRAVRTFGRHPFRFAYDPVGLWRALRAGPVDVLDIHEEPASLATFEVRVLARLARVRAPVCLYSAQNLPKRYPLPFRWFERGRGAPRPRSTPATTMPARWCAPRGSAAGCGTSGSASGPSTPPTRGCSTVPPDRSDWGSSGA